MAFSIVTEKLVTAFDAIVKDLAAIQDHWPARTARMRIIWPLNSFAKLTQPQALLMKPQTISRAIDGPTDIALTFTDYLDAQNEQARRYEQLTTDTIKFIGEVERVAKAPVSLISTRFDFRSIIDRRRW